MQRGQVSTERSGEYTTPWSSNMRRHLRNVHDVNQERVYECNKCKKIQVSTERSCGYMEGSDGYREVR